MSSAQQYSRATFGQVLPDTVISLTHEEALKVLQETARELEEHIELEKKSALLSDHSAKINPAASQGQGLPAPPVEAAEAELLAKINPAISFLKFSPHPADKRDHDKPLHNWPNVICASEKPWWEQTTGTAPEAVAGNHENRSPGALCVEELYDEEQPLRPSALLVGGALTCCLPASTTLSPRDVAWFLNYRPYRTDAIAPVLALSEGSCDGTSDPELAAEIIARCITEPAQVIEEKLAEMRESLLRGSCSSSSARSLDEKKSVLSEAEIRARLGQWYSLETLLAELESGGQATRLYAGDSDDAVGRSSLSEGEAVEKDERVAGKKKKKRKKE
eukprot:g5479.t1